MTQKGLPSSLDLAYEEAEGASFGLPANVDEQIKQQRERAAQRRQEASQPLEMPSIPQGVGGNSRAGTGKVPYMEHFAAAAQRYGVPINVLIGLAEQESRFNPTALGTQTKWGRAKGLMQYLDSTAAGMGINPYDPAQSIDAAARQLKQRLDKGYSMIDAVREHFAGPDRKLWGPKTHTYGVEVMQRASRYGNVAPISGSEAPSPAATQQTRPTAQSNNPDPNRFRPLSESELKKIQDAQMNGDDEVVLQIGMKPVKIMGGDPVIQKQRQQKIDDAGILSQFGNALSSGYDNTKRHVSNAVWMMTGDSTGAIADSIYEGYRQQQQAQKNRTSGQKRLDAAIDAVGDGEGFLDTLSRGLSAVKVAIQEPRATFLGSAESAASMLPTIAGGLAGAGAGGAVGAAGGAASGAVAGGVGAIPGAAAGGIGGAIWGGRIGMVAGTTASEAGAELEHMVFERLKDQKKSVTKENIQALLNDPKFRAEAQKQGTAKGLTLAMVDQLTMGAAGRVLSAPAKQAEKKAIKEIVKDTGVDEKAARSLLASPAGRAALAKHNPNTLKKAVAATGAFSIELMGEPAGEAISQAVARGEVDWSDVTGEFIYGAGIAVAGTAAAGAINAGQATADRIRSGGANTQTETQAEPASAAPAEPEAPAAPERKIGSIERAVGGEQSLDAAIDAEIKAVTGQPQPDSIEQLINQQTATAANEGTTAEQWLGQPGQTVQVSPKEDPDTTYTVTIEGYENGEVFARDQDGTPVQFGQNDIVSATPVQQTEPVTGNVQLEEGSAPELNDFGYVPQETTSTSQDGGETPRVQVGQDPDSFTNKNAQTYRDISDRRGLTTEIEDLAAQGLTARQIRDKLKADGKLDFLDITDQDGFIVGVRATLGIPSRADVDGQQEYEIWLKDYNQRKKSQPDANLSDFSDPAPQAAPDQPRAQPVEVDSPEKTLAKMDEAELRARIKYLAGQAKATGGWNKRLMEERRKVEAEINRRNKPEIDDKPYHKWEGMSPEQRQAMAEKAGFSSEIAKDLSQRGWGSLDKSITDKLTAKPAPKPKAAKAPEVKQPEAKKPKTDYSDAIPEQKQASTQEAAPFRQLIIDAHFNNPPMKAQLIQSEVKAGRPRHEVMKEVQGIVADIKAGKITAPAAQAEAPVQAPVQEDATPVQDTATTEQQPETQTEGREPLMGADGKPKWFMSQEKAQAHIEKKKLTGQYQVKKVDNRRFEIHPIAADTQETTATSSDKKTNETSGIDADKWNNLDPAYRVRILQTIGYATAQGKAQTSAKNMASDMFGDLPSATQKRIKKYFDEQAELQNEADAFGENKAGYAGYIPSGYPDIRYYSKEGQWNISNEANSWTIGHSPTEYVRGKTLDIAYDKYQGKYGKDVAAPSVVEVATSQPETQPAKQTTHPVDQWRQDMQEALAKADPEHPQFKKLQLNAKHGLKSENDRQMALRQAREIEKQEQSAPIVTETTTKQPEAKQPLGKTTAQLNFERNLKTFDKRWGHMPIDKLEADISRIDGHIKEQNVIIRNEEQHGKRAVNKAKANKKSYQQEKDDLKRYIEYRKKIEAEKQVAARIDISWESGADKQWIASNGMVIVDNSRIRNGKPYPIFTLYRSDNSFNQDKPYGDYDSLNEAKDAAKSLVVAETMSADTQQPEQSKPKAQPSANTLVSDDRAAELRARLKAKLSQLNSGIDPEILAIGAELAVYHIERGARTFTAFAKNVAADLDVSMDKVRPYLRSWYNGARDMIEDMGGTIEGMDSAETVRSELAKLTTTEENQNARTVQSENVPAGDQGGTQSDVTTGNRDSEPVAAGVAETSESTDRSEPVSASTQGAGRGGTRGVQPGQSAPGTSRDSGTVRTGLSTADAVADPELLRIRAREEYQKKQSDTFKSKYPLERVLDIFGKQNDDYISSDSDYARGFDLDGERYFLNYKGTEIRIFKVAGYEDSDYLRPSSLIDKAPFATYKRPVFTQERRNIFEWARENLTEQETPAAKQADPATAETSPKPEIDQPADFDLANEEIGKGGLTKKYKDNIAAIRILKAMEAEGRVATPEERKQIARYVGWGALKGVFDKDNKQWSKEYAELKGLLTDAEYKAARASTLNAHYTSPTVVGGIFKALEQVGFTSGRVLEPSVGTGNFFGLMPASMRKKSQLHGVELDPLTSQIAAALYPSAKIAKATGFQDFQVPSEYFDLAIGNPPFGSEPIVDSDRSPYSGSSIHNYFFAKSIDKLRPGGLLTMVVSHNFMDANNETTRKWISERADLVSAVRLPRTAFKENAGTDVVTDILVFRKRAAADGAGDASWVKTGTQKLTDPKTGNEVEHRVSSYFLANPNNVLGTPSAAGSMYRAAEYTVEPSGDLSKQLSDWAGTLPANMYQPIERTHEPEAADVSVPDGVKVGSFFVGENGAISVRGPDAMGNRTATEWTPPNAKAAERMKGMIGLRDTLREQMRLEKSPDTTTEQIEANRAELNRLYDEFNKKYGFLNDQTNRRLFLDDTESALLLALEFDYDKGVSKAVAAREEIDPRDPSAVKADIFNRRVMFPPADNIKVSNANDALLASLNYKARLDLPYMASLYDKTEAEIIQELGDVVYNDPINGYVMADEYLSGDVKTKLAEAQEAAKDNPDFKRNVEALKKIIPADKLPSEIHAALGASFIPTELFEQFAKEVTGADHRVAYVKATGQWVIDPRGQTNASLNVGKWGIAKMPATAIFARTMAGQGVVVTETVRLGGGKTETRVLEKETEAAREKQAAMKAEWQRWLWADPDRADRVASIYNEKMNRIVVRKYDGSHMTFPGMSPAINLLEHQKNAVWRALQSRQVLLDHTVGAGKTFEIVALFMEMRRLGIARKPFIAVPNHLTLQWRSEFSRLYPAANVLAATPEDFSKGNREKFFSKIVTGDWDAVIVGHSSLKKIALPPETEKAVLEEQINEIADAIDQMKRERGDRNIIRDMEGIRARLAARMTQRIQALGDRDKVVTFDELGVDAFAIDELHEFKNLFYNSTMERVPGMGNPAGSDKAFDLFVKLQWMFNTYGDKAPIAGATGTPVSNSLVEMFNMQRLLQYPTLKKDGLHVFDAWAKQFGSVESLYEVAPSGTGYRQSSRFAKFKNLPALMSHYQTFADTVTLDDLKAQEEAQGKAFPVPKVFGGRPQNIVAKRSPNVAAFMGTPELDIQDGQVQFGFNVAAGDRFEITKSKEGEHFNVVIVQNIDGAEVMQHLGTAKTEEDARLMLVEQALSPKIHVDPKSILGQFSNLKELNKKTKGKVNALSLTGQANKAGLDYRLVDPTAPDFAGSKINMAIDRMMTTYHKWDADKGTQLIFCDLSVPKSARSGFGSKERRVYVRDEKGAIVHKKGTLHTAEGFEDLPHLVIKEGKEFAIYDAATGLRIRGQLPSKAVALEWTKQTLGDEAKRQRWIDARDAAGDLDQDAIDDYNNANEINTEETEAISLSDIAGASGAAGFSVYDDIKAKLIAKGVPEREIAFIHDYSTPVAKDKLFKAVNSGAIRFLLGSTPKMGAGTNVQKRLVGLHHIDAPWRPSDLEQREGRIIRRGNILYERDPSGFEVEIYRYATEQTYDTRRWQILEHKSRGIEQLRNYDGTVNEIDDIEGEAANAADMKAAASGDPLILEETQLRNDVRRLESLQAAHADSTQMLFRRARDNQRFADEVGPRALQEFQDLQATAEKNPVKKDQFAGLTMNGRKIADREEAVKAIQKEMVRVFAGGSDASFTYRGIEFTLDNTMGYVELNSPTGRLDYFDPSKDTLPSAAGFLTRFANYISRIPAHIEDLNAKIAEAQRDAVELRKQADNPFAQAEELNAAREAHKRVQRRLIAKGPDIPAKQKPVLDQAMEAQKAALRDQGLGDAMDEFIGSRQNSRGQVTSTGTTVAEVRESLVNRFGEKTIAKLEKDGTLNIIDVLNEPGVEGFTAGGKVTLVADALTAESIVPVFLHELGGHVGFQGTMSPEAHANLVDQFNKLVRAGDPIALEAKRLAEREADAAAQQAEYLPYLVTVAARTQNKRPGIRNLIARIVSAVKAWAVDRLGMSISLNANDVLALAERMVNTVAENSTQVANDTVSFSRADNDLAPVSQEEYRSKLGQWWSEAKQLPSDLLTNSMRGWGLNIIPLRPMLTEIAKDIPAARTYLRIKDQMDAMRNEWHAKTDAVAQNWLKYRIKNREENRDLMDLMHEATLMQVDPSKPFESILTPRERMALENLSPGNPNRKTLEDKAEKDVQRQEAHKRLTDRYNALSPEGQSIFGQVRDAYSDMADAFDQTLLNNMEKAINVRIKKAEREYKREMERIKDEGLQGEERDNAVADADRRLKNAKTKIAWNRKARMTQLRQQFETQRLSGPYFPLARFGEFFVTVRDAASGEVVSFSRFENAREQRRFAEDMRKDKDYKVEVGALTDATATRKAVDPNFVADVEDILADLPNAEQVKDEVWQRYLESLPDMSIRKARIHRKGRAGYAADAVRAFGHHLFHGSHQLARMAHSMDLEDALDQARDEARETKDPTRSSLIVNEMEKRHQFVMNPTGGQLATWASSFAFVWYLAGSPKAAIMNLFQTPIMGVPILGAYAGGLNGMARAGNQLTKALVDFTSGRGYAERSARLNDEERDAMRKGYETGIIEKTQGHELAGVAESGVEYNAIRERVMKVIAWGFHHTERLNREVTFLAGYRLARAKGESHDQAITTAADLTWKTHFDYANTSRPRLMHNDTMKILLVFRNFQLNMLFRLFRDIHQVMHADSKEARREALTQLSGITGMMMLNAGITGTWGFGIAMLMAGLFMGEGEDPEEELKKGMVNTLGPNLAGLALYGVPGHVTGTALSESVGIPDLWFRSPDSEKEGEEALQYWQSQLLGAVPSIGAQFARGLSYIGRGEEYRGIETMMPKMLKDPMKSYRYATEGAKNMKGDTVADVTWADVVKQATGFTPARISEQYKINNLNYNKQQQVLKARKELMDGYYKAVKADDSAAVDEVLSRIEKHNEKNPDQPITPKGLIQSIKTRERGADSAVGGMRYNNKLRERILEEQAPSIYK